MASSSSCNTPCAACKFLRRKCLPGCIFAPYFPPEEPQKFANVHRIFGASNVTKLLNELLPHQREDAVNSLAYEAEARVRDPVYGCVGAISYLQRQIERLQKELDAANADLIRYACNEITTSAIPIVPSSHRVMNTFYQTPSIQPPVPRQVSTELTRRSGGNDDDGGLGFNQTPSFSFSYSSNIPWNGNQSGDFRPGGNFGGNL